MQAPVPFEVGLRVRFRGVTARQGMLVAGAGGWGEFCPFDDYTGDAVVPWLLAAREAADGDWPVPVRDRVPVNVSIPAVDPDRAAALVAAAPGCRTAKVKVAEAGQDPAADTARLEAVRDALGPGGRLRVDVNGAWDLDTAVARLRAWRHLDLEYVEQPCATVEELAAVRRRVDVPVAADESIRRAEDPLRVVRAEAADVAVLKVAPLGGVRACLRLAEQIGLPVVVSSALETSVGLAAGVALAAALPELPYACGLGTASLLVDDLVVDPLVPVDGFVAVRRPVVDPDRLARARLGGEAAGRWARRLADAEALAAAGGAA